MRCRGTLDIPHSALGSPITSSPGARSTTRCTGICVRVWQNISHPVVTLPKIWSAQSKPGFAEARSVGRQVPYPSSPEQGAGRQPSSLPAFVSDSHRLLESVCASPCACRSLPASHPFPCSYPLVCSAFLPPPFLGFCPLPLILLCLLFLCLTPSLVSNFLPLPFCVSVRL